MGTSRRINRRSFLAAVTGTGTLLVAPHHAGAVMQCNDRDSGPRADPPGIRACTGVTDGDPTDPAGRGRGARSGQPGQAERQLSCARLAQRREEIRRELIEPEYWAPSHREYAEQAAAQIQALFEADEDGYIHGRHGALTRRAEEIGSTYGGGDCQSLHCENIVYRLRERAARAGGSYNSARHRELLDEFTRLDAAIRRNCPQ